MHDAEIEQYCSLVYGVDKIGIGPDRGSDRGSDHGSDHGKKY